MISGRKEPTIIIYDHCRRDRPPSQQRVLKRKLGSFSSHTTTEERSYPSPMSSRQSQSRSPLRRSSGMNVQTGATNPTITASTASSSHMGLAQPYVSQPGARSYHELTKASPTSHPGQAGLLGPQTGSLGLSQQDDDLTPSARPLTSPSGPIESSGVRGGRKAKAHVASACINCKRAHLSCDVQRPCGRCVASGKQDTCYDVQHKKRGRPRLREDADFAGRQAQSMRGSQTTVQPTSITTSGRPIAPVRHTRTDSSISLHSQASENTSMMTPLGFQTPSLQSPFAYQQPPPLPNLSAAEVPTAYLDLNFVFLRANGPFEQIMSNSQDVRGRRLDEIAAPADNQDFQTVRNRLLTEREMRDPTHMPPMLPPGHNPIQGVSDADVERLTYGFSDHRYTWRRRQGGQSSETFPARVRLAKAMVHFVVVTLPTFLPVAPPSVSTPTSAFSASTQTPSEMYVAQRLASAPLANPSMVFDPYTGVARGAPFGAIGQQSNIRGYPPGRYREPYESQQQQNYATYQRPLAALTPRASTVAASEASAQFVPRTPVAGPWPPRAMSVQLPPIAGPSTMTSFEVTPMQAQQQGSPEEAEDSRERDRRKRRRMEIGEVLQR